VNDHEFIFTATDLIAHLNSHSKLTVKKLPRNALICLSPSVAIQVSKGQPWRTESAFGAKWTFVSDHLVLVSGFGLGAPACAAKLEEMKALGVDRVVLIGTAGVVQRDVPIGQVVLVKEAYSSEGTSRHYSADKKFAADEMLLSELAKILRNNKIEFRQGNTWSTDAPYRERRRELARLQNQGLMCVDMEASAVFAVAKTIGLKAASLFFVSDGLSDGQWRPGFGQSALREKFTSVAHQLIQSMARWNA
jgi:purine-nucleoside phosphorylase